MSQGKATLIENVLVLALLGVLAGALGGLGIGMATSHSSTAATSTAH